MVKDLASEAAKAAPPVTAIAAGFTLNEWVALLTGAYIVLQAAHLLWKWRKEAKANEQSNRSGSE